MKVAEQTSPADIFASEDIDLIASTYYGVYDSITDWGHGAASIVVAPIKEDGTTDWGAAHPVNLEKPSSDSGPADMAEARRWAILVDDIEACDSTTSMLLWLDPETGDPQLARIAGPEDDGEIAKRIIGRDIGAVPPAKEYKPGPLAQSFRALASEFSPAPVAANDNVPPAATDEIARLVKLQRQHGGEIRGTTLFGACIDDKRGQIYIGRDGKAAFVTANGAWDVDETPKAMLDIFAWKSSRFVGEPAPVEYLVDGVIEKGIPGMVAAMGEVGKSFSLLELSRRIAFGSSPLSTPIFGGQVVQEGTAVLITGEDDQTAMHRRLAAIDPKGARYAGKGDKLIVVPMPSAVGGINPFWRNDRQRGPVETDEWARLIEQLVSIPDLRSVVIDPLQLFAAVPLNEDPAAGQFVCGSVATVAAHLGTNVFFAHHMRKGAREIESLADARDSVRGTTALVDGVRLAYGLWYGDQEKAKKTCRLLGVPYEPNRIVHGGVLKANGAARRILSTYARNDFGLLVDSTASLGASAPDQGDILMALVISIEAAAASGQPFTKTGATGLFAMKERLPDELRGLSRHRLESLATTAIEQGHVVLCLAGGTTAKWLDVPGGQFAIGLGEFRKGMTR